MNVHLCVTPRQKQRFSSPVQPDRKYLPPAGAWGPASKPVSVNSLHHKASGSGLRWVIWGEVGWSHANTKLRLMPILFMIFQRLNQKGGLCVCWQHGLHTCCLSPWKVAMGSEACGTTPSAYRWISSRTLCAGQNPTTPLAWSFFWLISACSIFWASS